MSTNNTPSSQFDSPSTVIVLPTTTAMAMETTSKGVTSDRCEARTGHPSLDLEFPHGVGWDHLTLVDDPSQEDTDDAIRPACFALDPPRHVGLGWAGRSSRFGR